MTMPGRTVPLIWVSVLVWGLAACTSSTAPSPVASYTPATVGAAGSSPSSATTAPPTASPTATGANQILHLPLPGSFTAEQQTVARAWQGYWTVAVEAFRVPNAPHPDFGKVATGDALATITGYVNKLQTTKRHVTGSFTFAVTSVSVSGSTATGCGWTIDPSYEVDDATGKQMEPINPLQRPLKATLVKAGDLWRVTTSEQGAC